MNYYLTFDLGTTALKTALVGEDGSIAGACVSEYPPVMPAPGWVEMVPQTYWQAATQGTRAVLAHSRVNPKDVIAIGFSSQGQTFVALDHNGHPLYNAIVWLDSRARAIAEAWQRDWLTPEQFRRVSGYAAVPPDLTVFKIAWLQEHVPATQATWKYLWLPDYLIYQLTGETVTDPVIARMGGLFSLETGQWDPALLAAAGVRPDQLPEVRPAGAIAGRLGIDAAQTLGLLPGIPVCTGANDQLVGAIGAGNVRPGIVTETTGTALAVVATTTALLEEPCIVMGSHAIPDLYYGMCFANTSAVLLTWLREVCDKSQEDFNTFLADVAQIPVGCEGVTVLPHFMGDTPPNGSPQSRGAILGLSLGHTRAHLARAIMEACACLLNERMQPFRTQQIAIESVRSMGGGAKNDLWLQMKADLLGISVERPAVKETANLGAAMLAAVAVGQFPDLVEASAAWYRPEAVFRPDESKAAIYQEVYQRYTQYSQLFYSVS
jgi:sugar (pentulose or hexulose) kinase